MALMAHTSAGWEIRPHNRDDQSGIEAVFLRCLAEFPWRRNRETELEALLYARKYSTVLVATEPDAGIIGFIILQSDKAYVSHLFIDQDWRFCGIARGLLSVARTLSQGPLQLDVDERNKGAIAAYAALGWTEKVRGGPDQRDQRRLVGP